MFFLVVYMKNKVSSEIYQQYTESAVVPLNLSNKVISEIIENIARAQNYYTKYCHSWHILQRFMPHTNKCLELCR